MLLSLARAKHSRQAEEIATAHYRPQERRFRNFVKAPARLRDFALCWMFVSLASTGFLEQLKMPTDGALSTKCLQTPCH